MDILPHPRPGPEQLCLELMEIARFSDNRADIISTEIRIRKLEYNLSKQLSFEKRFADAKAKREAEKKAKAEADAAAFAALMDTNDGLIKVEAARAAKKPIPGDPRYAEFADSDDEDEELMVAPKMLSEGGGGEGGPGGFTQYYDQDFNKEAVLEILARASAFCSVRMRQMVS